MVCRDFILPEPASYVFFYALSNLPYLNSCCHKADFFTIRHANHGRIIQIIYHILGAVIFEDNSLTVLFGNPRYTEKF